MSRKCRIFEIDGAAGSVDELYAWITAGIISPPTKDTFLFRLRRGERRAEELRRPSDRLSARGIAARREGTRQYHEQRRGKAEAALLAGLGGTEPRRTEPRLAMQTSPVLPAAVLETLHCRQELPKIPEWTGWKPAYIRPGALDGWPGLQKALGDKQ